MTPTWLKSLNQPQLSAVTHGQGPLLILAGAGSGKTRALTYRAAYLIKEKGVEPKRILLVTFTNKAAKEMKDRIKRLVGDNNDLPFAGTFHSFCAGLLRRDGRHINLSPDFTIYDEDDSITAVKQAVTNLKLDPKRFKPRAIKAAISQAKNELLDPGEYHQAAKGDFYKTVAGIYPEYQRLLKQYQAVDFDDLLILAVKLLTVKEVLNKYRQLFEYVLVDEYQDTNKAQYQLTKMLTLTSRNLTVVGDAAQSIYSWRGADYRNLLSLKADFPDLTIINLEQNYRSSQNILSAANAVIAKNRLHPILNLWTNSPAGEKISLFEADDETVEARFLIASIKVAKKPLSHFAVLYRTNAQSRVIEEALVKAGVPYVLIGGVRFYDRKEIKDLLAYLRFCFNPKDAVSYQRLAKLGKRQLGVFLDWLQKDKIVKLTWPTKKLLTQILKVVAFEKRFNPKDPEELSRLENIKELLSVAKIWPKLGEFLENVTLIQASDVESNQDSVTLMTLHASKGLEFDTIFMIGMEEGLFPHSRSLFSKEELEEERRLCYVGMTRAKQKLYFTFTRRRLYFGLSSSNAVSRFLGEIDESLVEAALPDLPDDNAIININDY